MSDAQQEPSPDFVLMRLVSAAEYDRLDEPEDLVRSGFGPVKAALGHRGGGFDVDPGGPSSGLGSGSPHYSSPLAGKGELDGGLVLTQAPLGSEPPGVLAPPQDGSAGPGSRAQLMVFQNLLRSGDRILEFGPEGFLQEEAERQHLDPGPGSGPGGTTSGPGPGGGLEQSSCRVPSAEEDLQWHPVLRLSKVSEGPQNLQQDPGVDPDSGPVLCHRHRLAKWPPGLLDQALRLGLLEHRKTCSSGAEDPVLVLAQRLGQLGEGGGISGGGTPGGSGPVFSSGTLSGLMQQVHRLAEEAGVCTDQNCRSAVSPSLSTTAPSPSVPPQTAPVPAADLKDVPVSPDPTPRARHQSRSQPQSRAATPKLGVASGGAGRSASPLVVLDRDKTSRKSRKGGSLKVRLSKLFRTKSSSGGSGGLLDKRPSLASSTSSGGSLLDVWGSTCSNTDQDSTRLQVSRPHSAFSPVPFSPPFTGETVSLVDVDISRRAGTCLHPPTPPPPPRRSLSLLDDFGGPPQNQGAFMERTAGASMQSLPPRPLALPPSLSAIQHSLSLNDTFLRGLPRPVPLRPDGQNPPARLAPRCPLSRADAGSFATSLRELEKCGWYWGPMNWEDAEMKLKGKPDGSFLVRDSSDPRYILSLSFRSQGVTHHTRMEHYRGTFSLWCHPKFEDRCHSVVEFIERAIMHSKNGKFLYFLRSRVPGLPPTPVQLLYPVSRFSSVKSLQHLCRFCIRQLVRIDHIQELPLPTPLISYLRKFYYYDPEEEISPPPPEGRESGSDPGSERGPDRSSEQSGPPGVESQT
ncbi:suppressor of cytokine signaling 7 [Austrofundulus limnaeus]|uniref:Suppressor of cytokine signaling 7 n=1 Tax=Austrofundulus limnaeus TaxID=52670 RepID=A0A2I4CF08_AUSLI|nr:PREDICTED: suppressor of cytokine signaling 7 [Austrofundulus limnaeus]